MPACTARTPKKVSILAKFLFWLVTRVVSAINVSPNVRIRNVANSTRCSECMDSYSRCKHACTKFSVYYVTNRLHPHPRQPSGPSHYIYPLPTSPSLASPCRRGWPRTINQKKEDIRFWLRVHRGLDSMGRTPAVEGLGRAGDRKQPAI